MTISGLNRTARSLAVYASQPGSPRHHARLASGCWPSSAGRGWLPAGFQRKVSAFIASSFPKLSWRTKLSPLVLMRGGRCEPGGLVSSSPRFPPPPRGSKSIPGTMPRWRQLLHEDCQAWPIAPSAGPPRIPPGSVTFAYTSSGTRLATFHGRLRRPLPEACLPVPARRLLVRLEAPGGGPVQRRSWVRRDGPLAAGRERTVIRLQPLPR